MTRKIGLAVLLSGSGTTLQNILDRIDAGRLDAAVKVVVSSRPDAYGLTRAAQRGIPAVTVPSKKYHSPDEHSRDIWAEIEKHSPDLIVMAGFMCLLHIPSEYEGRVMNIHPALLPSFGGKGMYGEAVHRAVLEAGCKLSGCTVHFADNRYDRGPIIVQRACPVADDDTPETLRERVFREECEAYPQAIQLFAEGRLRIEGRRVRVLPPTLRSDSGLEGGTQ